MKSTKIELDGKKIDHKIIEGSENEEKTIDITNLRKESGYVTYDPGLVNTGSCLSDITFIDGKEGILDNKGYPIEEHEKASFLDVCYLLIYGELPDQEKVYFADKVKHHTMIHEDFKNFLMDILLMLILWEFYVQQPLLYQLFIQVVKIKI